MSIFIQIICIELVLDKEQHLNRLSSTATFILKYLSIIKVNLTKFTNNKT